MAGFHSRYRKGGGAPTVQSLKFKDSETITRGDLLNLESGTVDLAATGDRALLGTALETKTGVASTSEIEVIIDADVVYGVVDNNARKKGDVLDITGSTGAMGVTTATNRDLVVEADSSATEETLVRANVGKHHENTAS